MKIDLFKNLDLPENPTLQSVLTNFFAKNNSFLTKVKNYVTEQNLEQVIIPTFDSQLSHEMKQNVVLSLLILHELTTSPVFLLHAEFFASNEKLSSFDTLFFLYGLIQEKIKQNYGEIFQHELQSLYILQEQILQFNIVYDAEELAKLQ